MQTGIFFVIEVCGLAKAELVPTAQLISVVVCLVAAVLSSAVSVGFVLIVLAESYFQALETLLVPVNSRREYLEHPAKTFQCTG